MNGEQVFRSMSLLEVGHLELPNGVLLVFHRIFIYLFALIFLMIMVIFLKLKFNLEIYKRYLGTAYKRFQSLTYINMYYIFCNRYL